MKRNHFSVLMSLEPILISQSKKSVEEKEEDNKIFDRFQFDQVYIGRRGHHGNNEAKIVY